MHSIDLNADIGEGRGDDEGILQAVSSASIACGGHAGDAASMQLALRRCRQLGVAAGAHPSHVDAANFGRQAHALTPGQVHALVKSQLAELLRLAALEGMRLQHCKPHGALYHQLAQDPVLAEAACQAVLALDARVAVMGLAGSQLPAAARRLGLRALDEAFADRAYRSDGSLLPRSQANAVLHNPAQALAQVLSLSRNGGLRSHDGQWLPIRADTVCVHGDTPGAAALALALRDGLQAQGVAVKNA